MAGPTWARTDYALCLVPSGLLAAEFIDWCSLLPSSPPSSPPSHTHSTHSHTTTATHHHDHPPPPAHTTNKPTTTTTTSLPGCLEPVLRLLGYPPGAVAAPIVPLTTRFQRNLGDGSVANRVFLDRLVGGGFWGPVDLPPSGEGMIHPGFVGGV